MNPRSYGWTQDFLLESDPLPPFPSQRIKVWYDDFTGRKYPVQKHPYGKHMKRSFSLHFVTAGIGYFAVEDSPLVKLEKGDAFFIHDRQLIRYFPDETDPWEYCGISFGAPEMAPFFRKISWNSSHVLQRDSSTERMAAILCEFIEEWQNGAVGHYALLGCIGRILSLVENRSSALPPTPSSTQLYVSRVKEYLELGYSNPALRITQAASAVNLSHPYLCRIFKQLEGCSPEQYLLRYRMQVANRLLKSTEYSVSEVAFLCGYADPAQFSRMYKRHFGIAPSEERP